MEIEQFLTSLKNKYNYSNDLIDLLRKAIPAFIKLYGEDKKNIIFGALYDCEIHIQQENENMKDYLNEYFGTNDEWDFPFLASAMQHNQLTLKDNKVNSKSIIYVRTKHIGHYKPFDLTNDSNMSLIIHEICHAIKSYKRINVEDGKVITGEGLMLHVNTYDPETNTFKEEKTDCCGIEEAINSYDEAEIMTMITGEQHMYGGYKGMTSAARIIMNHKELREAIRNGQFEGTTEWKDLLGESAQSLVKSFDDWVDSLYVSPIEISNNQKEILEKLRQTQENIKEILSNYTTPKELEEFLEAKKNADKKTLEVINKVITYNSENNKFEEQKLGM